MNKGLLTKQAEVTKKVIRFIIYLYASAALIHRKPISAARFITSL